MDSGGKEGKFELADGVLEVGNTSPRKPRRPGPRMMAAECGMQTRARVRAVTNHQHL